MRHLIFVIFFIRRVGLGGDVNSKHQVVTEAQNGDRSVVSGKIALQTSSDIACYIMS